MNVAAVVHDVGHTGQTNQYHIHTQSDLAIRYNDRSVLENYHLALAFQLLKEPHNNFLETLTVKEYRYVRDAVVLSKTYILSFHFVHFEYILVH